MRQLFLLVAVLFAVDPGWGVSHPMATAAGAPLAPAGAIASADDLQGQSPAPVAGATIRGRVVDAADGKPVRRADVFAQPEFVPGTTINVETARTDDAGRFELTGLSPGRVRVTVTKAGFVPDRPGAWPDVDLQAGRTVDVQIRMQRGAAISGTVVDETGEPVPRARMSVMKVRYVDWQPSLTRIGTWQMTDDAGRFRVYGLAPGQYYLLATPMSSEPAEQPAPGYSPTFYPGALAASSAGVITVAAGQQLSGLSFPIVPVPTGSISGVVVGGPAGTRAPLLTVRRLQTTGSLTMAAAVATTVLVQGGAFSYGDLAPGTYQILATSDTYRAVQQVAVNDAERVSNVVLTLRAGATIQGTVRASPGSAASFDPTRVRLSLVSTDPFDVSSGEFPAPASDGTFRWSGVHTARAFVRAAAPGWLLERVLQRGLDVTDVPVALEDKIDDLEIVLTDRASRITGTVLDEEGRPVRRAAVVVFADDSARWGPGTRFSARVSSETDGRFTVGELPSGRYRVLALEALDPGDEMDPERLEQWRLVAERVDLAAGALQQLELRVRR